jgi:hypothetical protein
MAQFTVGDWIRSLGEVDGDDVGGNTDWHVFRLDGKYAYINASSLSISRPRQQVTTTPTP